MKKVIVTGGCGFIGSNLVDILVSKGHEVTVIDNLITGKEENANEDASYIYEDYREVLSNPSRYFLDKGEYDTIFHLAAMPRIQPSFDDPLYTFNNNAYGTAILCDFAKQHDIKIVYAGSSSFYGGVYLNPYSFSKWVGEEICQMYSKIYGISSCVARFFNVYGPRHLKTGPYSTVVGVFEEQYDNSQPLTVTGDGEQRRDFTHVYDICSGLIAMSDARHNGEIFNLGTGKNYSINELANLFPNSTIKYIPKRPGEAKETLADISKAASLLNYEPVNNLQEYVRDIADSRKTK
jgi:nucleoside-diphosphate-sugar epimerase